MSNGIKLNATQAAVLGLLADGPATGGDVWATAREWMSGYWNMTRSQIYRELPLMCEYGFLREGKQGVRKSVPYKITAKGKKALRAWLAETPSEDTIRNQTALRVSLALLQEPERVEAMLTEMHDRHLDLRKAAQKKLDQAEAEGLLADAAALGFTVAYHNAVLGWLESIDTMAIFKE